MRLSASLSALVLSAAVALPAAAQRSVAETATKPAPKLAAAPTVYAIDPTHSELSFRIRHLLGRVSGTFGQWSGTIAMDEAAPANSKVDVSIKTTTIDTKNEMRDNHLRSVEFFAADSFPAITFKSTKVTVTGKAISVAGDLTIRGRTKPVVLVGDYAGTFKDAQGMTRTAFSASTKINRNDFGVAWNKAVETGAMLGDEVTIEISVEAIKQ